MTIQEKFSGRKLQFGTILALVVFIIGSSITYGKIQQSVANNKESINKLVPNTEQIARLEENVEDLQEDVKEIKTVQRERFDRVDDKMDKLLQAILK